MSPPNFSFRYDVHIEATITREEVDKLLEYSSRHYDGVCKAAGQVGGFIYGWSNYFSLGEETPLDEYEFTISRRELDLVAKICEISDRDLYRKYLQMCKAANNQMREVNETKALTSPGA